MTDINGPHPCAHCGTPFRSRSFEQTTCSSFCKNELRAARKSQVFKAAIAAAHNPNATKAELQDALLLALQHIERLENK